MTELKPGLQATETITVDNTNTAKTMGSGSLDVFATPSMVALMEKAACSAIKEFLDPSDTSVGISLNITHDSATLLGKTVTATAKLTEVDGKKLTFAVSAKDDYGNIGKGTHQRFIVNVEKFINKLKNK